MSSPTTKQTHRQDSDSGDVQPKRRRTTRGSATNVQPPIAYDREEFNFAWRLLRRDKWFSKPPRGLLSDQYRYVPPGGDPDGIAGVDYFLGEQALVEEYNKTIGAVNQTCTIVELDAQAGEAMAVVVNVNRGADAATEDCASSEKDGLSESTRCAVCSLECSRDRTCTSCNKFMHHFCSHEVCMAMKVFDAEGNRIEDFGDSCYCSKKCFVNATSTFDEPRSTQFFAVSDSNNACTMLENIPANRVSGETTTANANTKKRSSVVRTKAATKSATASGKPKKRASVAAKNVASTCRPKEGRTLGSTAKQTKTTKATPKKPSKLAAMKAEMLLRARDSAAKFIDAKVAFSPAQEDWMSSSLYPDVGGAYLIGVMTRYIIDSEARANKISVPVAKFQIQWTNTSFQTKDHVHNILEEDLDRGIRQFVQLQKNKPQFAESWASLCNMVPQLSNIPALTDDFEEVDEHGYKEWSNFRGRKEFQIALSPAEVEAIESMHFDPDQSIGQPPGLFVHPDGSVLTKVKDESRHLFEDSATSSFFAFIPLSFWSQVVVFTNEYAAAGGNPSPKDVVLDELMVFLGILWYMTLFDKGEMLNYWRDNEEASIFPGASSTSLDAFMSWNRFIYIRKNLSFRSSVTVADIEKDPAARIRPLISILKSRCGRHVAVGRNVAVDEASIACRSQYARHVIVYNPRKPTGKYHFKMYVCCCSTSWYVLSFKLHCSSVLEDRLSGVVPNGEIAQLAELTKESSEIRSHVIEVTSLLKGSRRIVNTDNFYTSCLLLESLRSIGLYGRGTVRTSSKHFPHFTMIKPGDSKPRGYMKQGVCLEQHIVAASWVDGSIVNVVSNADASTSSTVYRRISQNKVAFEAPTCIGEYNSAMQGVDRHDQLRGRFSLASGHSFQKWHKKLALAMVDIARCNAYVCHELVHGRAPSEFPDPRHVTGDCLKPKGRDNHRAFVISLVRELLHGDWKKCVIENENGMLYANDSSQMTVSAVEPATVQVALADQPQACVAKESWVVLKERSRSMRKCTVCKFEGRDATEKTDFCETHRVALCKRTYPADPSKPHLCQQAGWTCWQKYHSFYFPKQVYTAEGNLRRASPIYKAQSDDLKERKSRRSTTSTDVRISTNEPIVQTR